MRMSTGRSHVPFLRGLRSFPRRREAPECASARARVGEARGGGRRAALDVGVLVVADDLVLLDGRSNGGGDGVRPVRLHHSRHGSHSTFG